MKHKKGARQALCFLSKASFLHPLIGFCLLFCALPHSLYLTKLIPSTKSSLHPLSISLGDCLNPGHFSHLSYILCDIYKNLYSPYSHNSLYNKLNINCGVIQELCQDFILLNFGQNSSGSLGFSASRCSGRCISDEHVSPASLEILLLVLT